MVATPVVQNFLRYRKRFRVGELGLIPISSEKAPQLTGFPPNLMHDSDTYESVVPYVEGQNADGYVFSLTGERLTAALPVTQGHLHDSDKTFLPWWPIGSWQFPANIGTIPEAASMNALSGVLGVTMGCMPAGANLVAIRGCVSGPSAAGAALFFFAKASIYGDNANFLNPLIHSLTWDLSVVHDQTWLESQPIDVSGLSFTASRQLLVLWNWGFDQAPAGSEATIYNLQIGAVG